MPTVRTPRKKRIAFFTPKKKLSVKRVDDTFERKVNNEKRYTDKLVFDTFNETTATVVSDSLVSSQKSKDHQIHDSRDQIQEKKKKNQEMKKKNQEIKKTSQEIKKKNQEKKKNVTKGTKNIRNQEKNKENDKLNKENNEDEKLNNLIQKEQVLKKEALFLEKKIEKLKGPLFDTLQEENHKMKERLSVEQLIGFKVINQNNNVYEIMYSVYNKEIIFKLSYFDTSIDYKLISYNLDEKLPTFLTNEMEFEENQLPKFIYNLIMCMIGKSE
ncbi:hypothetical protein M153_47680001125 [Pseudoloma neurophilia]|uniref:DUF5094 domain-containing protein n=1 Tax=Pseudoloma neurophilia TaxID=146866 RepID=A0A0R0LT99_9MICR|nr:hypothetical protein M153_47680001125 [Pseudoloma neurophilia]